MGAYSYCTCGNPKARPAAFELLYGRKCTKCGVFENFDASEKIDHILEILIEKERENPNG